jgi:dipeptidyl aminopeptidase/acylaminoacyl peptidase
MRKVMSTILLCLVVAFSRLQNANGEEGKRRFTVEDSIALNRVVRSQGPGNPVLISPDARRFLVIVQRGDIARNGVWIEFLAGAAESIHTAQQARVVTRLFSISTATDVIQSVHWLNDSKHVVFLWDPGKEPVGVRMLDATNGSVTTLVQTSNPVVRYDTSSDGNIVVYMTGASPASGACKKSVDFSKGLVLAEQPIWTLLNDCSIDSAQHYDTFVLNRAKGTQFRLHEPRVAWGTSVISLAVSPDGQFAITSRPVSSAPSNWDQYTNHLFRDVFLAALRRDSSAPSLVFQYFIIDIKARLMRPLWDAPENTAGALLWSKDSKSIVLGPTFLPISAADKLALEGQAVAEVDVATGHFSKIPLPENRRNADRRPMRWVSDQVVEIGNAWAPVEGKKSEVSFEKTNGEWKSAPSASVEAPAPKVSIEVREDPNTPPGLYAIDTRTAATSLIRNFNPQLGHLSLGRVETVHWKGRDGTPWTGLLDYPIDYESGKSYPLVVQTHGYLANQFAPDGVFTTVFAAQALANHDIAVLQMGAPDVGLEKVVMTAKEPVLYMAGLEGAIDAFVSQGLADREKIGVIGFSRTGWHVEYLLTHSKEHFAAAEVADNIDGGYLQYLLRSNDAKSEFDVDHGARPFGEGLEAWLRTAPAFNADQITAPLRLELDSGPADTVLVFWEMFSNLRSLGKPVELFLIPDIQHGAHILQNPRQRLASQGSSVDWFCFWLKDERDPDPGKAEEYQRWQRLKQMNSAVAGPS